MMRVGTGIEAGAQICDVGGSSYSHVVTAFAVDRLRHVVAVSTFYQPATAS